MITYIIIGVTVAVSLLCFSNRSLWYKLSLNPYSMYRRNEWYRIITHGFVHGDYTHLFVNMLVLWSFGTNVEYTFGSLEARGALSNPTLNFMMLYFGGMIFSSIPDVMKHKENVYYNSIGASGAVSAVLFASIFFAPWSKIYFMAIVPIPSILFGASYLWYSQYMNKRGGNINHMAHFWGAIFGLIYPIIANPSLIKIFLTQLTNPKF